MVHWDMVHLDEVHWGANDMNKAAVAEIAFRL